MTYHGFHSFEDADGWRFGLFEVFAGDDGFFYWVKLDEPDASPHGPFQTARDAYIAAMAD